MKDGYHVNCTVSSNFLLDKGRVAENLQKECLCYFIIKKIKFVLIYKFLINGSSVVVFGINVLAYINFMGKIRRKYQKSKKIN